MLKDLSQKNGFVMASYEFSFMNNQLEGMKSKCKDLIELINQEIK